MQTVVVADVVHPDQLLVSRVLPDDERPLINDMELPFGSAWILRELEDVGIFPDQVLKDILLAINLRRPAVNIVERTHVIESTRVVFMIVSQ